MTEPSAAVKNEPSDLELMMYMDGELDPERAAQIARFLEENPRAGAGDKLFGLSVLSAHVRHEADRVATVHEADSIVAGVFESIRAEQDGASNGKANGRSRLADVVSITEAKSTAKAPAQKPANDNARLIFGLAGLAAAAAIALGIWGRGAPPLNKVPATEKVAVVEATSEAPPAPVVEQNARPTQIESNKKPSPPVQDDTPAVAVAAVDFGTKTGAVYYVPSDSHGPTTTVVWVSDE
jgi:hypothetical protein